LPLPLCFIFSSIFPTKNTNSFATSFDFGYLLLFYRKLKDQLLQEELNEEKLSSSSGPQAYFFS